MTETESKDEQLDRELIELLNELRVALPGVQMLFGFLLALPFSVGFEQTSAADRRVYFTSFVAAAAASVFLIAPSAYHRLMWRQREKEHLLRAANAMAIAGLACLAIAVIGAGVDAFLADPVAHEVVDRLTSGWRVERDPAGTGASVIFSRRLR